MYRFIRPLLFALPPELSHRLALQSLRAIGLFPATVESSRPVRLLGLEFPNRVGLAAGFDKNAESIDGLWHLGFGFVEVGTVTPRAQPGQPAPRLFRLPGRHALVNRMGFPNRGLPAIVERLRKRRSGKGIVGVNIGKNADTPLDDAINDYVTCLQGVAEVADYVAINISSPNTVALRDLHAADKLAPLLTALVEARDCTTTRPPLLLKISPDLDAQGIREVAGVIRETGIDGVIATNTTANIDPAGGLSGEPLRSLACQVVTQLREYLGPQFPIIGTGGIDGLDAARAMRSAGADLLQIYTGMVYEGPSLVRECVRGLD